MSCSRHVIFSEKKFLIHFLYKTEWKKKFELRFYFVSTSVNESNKRNAFGINIKTFGVNIVGNQEKMYQAIAEFKRTISQVRASLHLLIVFRLQCTLHLLFCQVNKLTKQN